MQASISLSSCLRRSRTRPSLWYGKNRDSSLKIQCLHCLRFHTRCLLPNSRRHCLCSKLSLGHPAVRRDQYPAARSRLRMVRTDIRLPNRPTICIRRRGADMKRFVLTIRSSWRSSRGDFHRTSTLSLMWSVSLSDALQKFCLCIVETPPVAWLLLAENCHLPTTWQFAAVFAVATFVAWSPLKVQRNIHSPYRNPVPHKSIKVVMARQTSLQVTTPELTFYFSWVSAVPRQYWLCLAISIWLHSGSIKSTVFRSAIEHTTRNNKYRSNSRKCHLVVMIP